MKRYWLEVDDFSTHETEDGEWVKWEDVAAVIGRLREENRHAGNLLAVMHGDGGHYISKHGWAKACEDAEQIRHGYKEEIDRLEAAHKKADDTIADYEQAAARLMCKCGITVENNNISDYERIITAEIDRLRARYVHCAVCQMPVDTWDECEGGNAYGCLLSRGRWACSIQCWDRFVVRSEIAGQAGVSDE